MDPGEILEAARANELVAIENKVAAGRVLSARELALLQDSAGFSLEGERPPGPLAGLKQQELAARYGYSLRAVKKWIHAGRAKNDPPPLDRPADMPAWFERIHPPRQAPEKLRLAVAAIEEGSVPAAAVAGRVEVGEAEQGFEAMLRRLRGSEAMKFREYEIAVDAGDSARASFLFSEWSKIVERLRAMEKTAARTLADLGIYVRKDDVERELGQIHAAIPRALKISLRRQRREAAAAAGDQAEWYRFVERSIDAACIELVESDFAEPLELGAA